MEKVENSRKGRDPAICMAVLVFPIPRSDREACSLLNAGCEPGYDIIVLKASRQIGDLSYAATILTEKA
jgi:hypothetical protein